MSTKNIKKSDTLQFLESITGGPVSLGKLIESIRLGEEMTQPAFAKKMGISKSHLNDIEKERKFISPLRASRFAKKLGYSEARFVTLALQGLIDEAGLRFKVDLQAA